MLGGCLLFTIGIFADPAFLTSYNIQNLVRTSSIIGTIAIGVSTVMLTKEIDLSVGSLMAFTIILSIEATSVLAKFFGWSAIQGGHYMVDGAIYLIGLTLLIGVLVGLFNGVLVTKLKIKSLITTLGVLYAARALAYIISGGHSVYLTRLESVHWIGKGNFMGVPTPFIIFLVTGLTLAFLLKYTFIGKRIYSIGGNENAAIFAGINTEAWKIGVFAFSGFCAALAALMYSSYLESVDPQQAVGYELSAIATVILGGTTLEGGYGKITGTMLAALVLGVLTNVLELIGLRIWYQQVIFGAIIITAVLPKYLGKELESA